MKSQRILRGRDYLGIAFGIQHADPKWFDMHAKRRGERGSMGHS